MTRLKRITNKIFGNTASTTGSSDTGPEIGQFGSAKAGTYNATADVETIQALPAYEQGWIGAVIPDQQYPTLPEMTGVNKVLSYQTGYLMQEGIPEWDSGTTYYKNSIVKYAKVTTTQTTTVSDLVLYKSLTDDNTGNNPTAKNSIHWEVLNLGGGSGLENKITNCILEAPNGVATYSGNTITIKQGLKALAPNGRNADRTLRNNEYKVNNDFTMIVDSIYTGKQYLYLTNNDSASYTSADHVFVKSSTDGFGPPLTTSTKEQWYDDYTNYDNVHLKNQSNWDIISDVIIGEFYWDGSIISDFITYAPIDILKRSNKSEISGWGMPSKKYIDLTLGASGTIYTAPATGFYSVKKVAGVTNAFFNLHNVTSGLTSQDFTSVTANHLRLWLPCKKGDLMQVEYSATGNTMQFRFNYAEGEI